jgi:hypothetical protein
MALIDTHQDTKLALGAHIFPPYVNISPSSCHKLELASDIIIISQFPLGPVQVLHEYPDRSYHWKHVGTRRYSYQKVKFKVYSLFHIF